VVNRCPDVDGNLRIMRIYRKLSGPSSDQRKVTDRRRQELAWPNERRLRPDRRLNSISVEWIPFNEVYFHPITRDAFGSNRAMGKKSGQMRGKDTREKDPSRRARCDKEKSPTRSWASNIFKRNQRADVEQRSITDRRTMNIKLAYNRRVRPDRRLNNISIEWITFE